MNPPELPKDLPPPLPNPGSPVTLPTLPKRPTPLNLTLLGRMNVSLLLAGINAWMLSFADPDSPIMLFAFVATLLAATLLPVVFLLQFWQKVDDGALPHSPAAYAWLNLVPVLNLYWQFISFVGLTKAVNRQLEARRPGQLKVSVGLAVARCVCGVAGFVAPLFLMEEFSPLAILASASLVSPLTVILDFFIFRAYIKAFETLEAP